MGSEWHLAPWEVKDFNNNHPECPKGYRFLSNLDEENNSNSYWWESDLSALKIIEKLKKQYGKNKVKTGRAFTANWHFINTYIAVFVPIEKNEISWETRDEVKKSVSEILEELNKIDIPPLLKEDANILAKFKLPSYIKETDEIYQKKKEEFDDRAFARTTFREYIDIYKSLNSNSNEMLKKLNQYLDIASFWQISIKEDNFYTWIMWPNKQFRLINKSLNKELKFSFSYSSTPYEHYN